MFAPEKWWIVVAVMYRLHPVGLGLVTWQRTSQVSDLDRALIREMKEDDSKLGQSRMEAIEYYCKVNELAQNDKNMVEAIKILPPVRRRSPLFFQLFDSTSTRRRLDDNPTPA